MQYFRLKLSLYGYKVYCVFQILVFSIILRGNLWYTRCTFSGILVYPLPPWPTLVYIMPMISSLTGLYDISLLLHIERIDNREFKKPRRRHRGQRRLKNELYFSYEYRDTRKSFSLFLSVKTISKLNLEHSDKFEIEI